MPTSLLRDAIKAFLAAFDTMKEASGVAIELPAEGMEWKCDGSGVCDVCGVCGVCGGSGGSGVCSLCSADDVCSVCGVCGVCSVCSLCSLCSVDDVGAVGGGAAVVGVEDNRSDRRVVVVEEAGKEEEEREAEDDDDDDAEGSPVPFLVFFSVSALSCSLLLPSTPSSVEKELCTLNKLDPLLSRPPPRLLLSFIEANNSFNSPISVSIRFEVSNRFLFSFDNVSIVLVIVSI